MSLISYTPAYINTTENQATKTVITPEHWNTLFNMLIAQGNNSATAIYNMLNAIAANTAAEQVGATTITGVTGTTVQTIMAGLKGLLDLCYTASATDTLLAQKESLADANQLVKSITFNNLDGKFTITKQDGTISVIDTAFEKVAINFTYNQDTQSLVLTLADGNTTTIPLSALIQENDFLDSDTIDFTITNHTVTAVVKNASITEAMLTSATLSALVGYKNAAETSATNAAASEANALTYKNSATQSASEALASKNAAKTSETNSKTSETNAKASETNAKTSETNAATSAAQALQYRNEASSIVGDKVISFNGRKDVVVPANGDYTAAMVGAIDVTEKGTASGVASLDETGKVLPEQLPAMVDTSITLSDAVKTALGLTGTKYVSDGFMKLSENTIGTIVTTVRSDLGNKYALCNGANIRKTTYSDLFDILTSTPSFYYSSWTTATGLNTIYGLKYVNNKYFFWGLNSSGYCAISYATDLSKTATWTVVQISASAQCLTNFTYSNGFYFGFFNSSYAFFSSVLTDTWAYVTTANSFWYIFDVAYGSGNWAFIGYNSGNGGLGMINTTSSLTNGVNQTLVGLTAVLGGYWCKNIIFDGTRFVTGCTNGGMSMVLYYATNPASTWTAGPTTTVDASYSSIIDYFAYENGQYVIAGHINGNAYHCWLGYTSTYNVALTLKVLGSWGTSVVARAFAYVNGYYFVIMQNPSGYAIILSCATINGSFTVITISGISAGFSPPLYINGEYIIALNSNSGYVVQSMLPTGDQKALPTLTDSGLNHYIKLI